MFHFLFNLCSPIGEVFRARLRQFPALVNCCTIDWFSEWPADALRSVAIRFLNDIPDLDADDAIMEGLVIKTLILVKLIMMGSYLILLLLICCFFDSWLKLGKKLFKQYLCFKVTNCTLLMYI